MRFTQAHATLRTSSGSSAFALTAIAIALVCGTTRTASAQWNPTTGTKTGSGAAIESSSLWIGPQLQVLGGSLSFSGSARANGPVLLQAMNGWTTPIVNVAGTFTMNGASFNAVNGARLTVNGASPGTVNTGTLGVFDGSQVTIGATTVSGNLDIRGGGASLHVMGNYTQSGGDFLVGDGVSSFRADGVFNYSGANFKVEQASLFSVGNPTAGTVNTGTLGVFDGSQVTIGATTVSGNLNIRGGGASLHVMGNYTQSGGDFLVGDGVSSFRADGVFNYSGANFKVEQVNRPTSGGRGESIGVGLPRTVRG